MSETLKVLLVFEGIANNDETYLYDKISTDPFFYTKYDKIMKFRIDDIFDRSFLSFWSMWDQYADVYHFLYKKKVRRAIWKKVIRKLRKYVNKQNKHKTHKYVFDIAAHSLGTLIASSLRLNVRNTIFMGSPLSMPMVGGMVRRKMRKDVKYRLDSLNLYYLFGKKDAVSSAFKDETLGALDYITINEPVPIKTDHGHDSQDYIDSIKEYITIA